MNARFPAPLDWKQRAKGVVALPGGYDGYLASLKGLCEIVDDLHPTPVELAELLLQHFKEMQTLKSASHREAFLRKAGILTVRGGQCYVSGQTEKWIQTGDASHLIGLMHSRLCFFGEMLAELRQPLHAEDIRAVADTKYGLKWNTNTQIQLRRGWLQSAKLITVNQEQKLALTDTGRRLAGLLDLHEPSPTDKAPETKSVVNEVEQLAAAIVDASTDSKNPRRFERAVRDGFTFLGFDTRLFGGSGRTDVLLKAPLGKDGAFRATVDAKTVGAGSLGDHQVDWLTLKDHQRKHQADYSILVGPQPVPGRLTKRAEGSGIAVLSASLLAGLCRQHAEAPLGLADYRTLFAQQQGDGGWTTRGGEVDTSELDEAALEAPRMRNLATAVVSVLSERSMTVGALRARDLWLIMLDRGEIADGSAEEEIQDLLDMLAHPLVRAVDGDAENGYVLSSNPAVTRMRLQHLAAAIAPESGS